jgi:hypothetical protein
MKEIHLNLQREVLVGLDLGVIDLGLRILVDLLPTGNRRLPPGAIDLKTVPLKLSKRSEDNIFR